MDPTHQHKLDWSGPAGDEPFSLAQYFSEADFMPHGHCFLWKPGLVWSHVLSDLFIGLAYFGISLTLYFLVKKIKIPFSATVLSFGIFIGACGATHFMEIYNLWVPSYWMAALVKIITALASVTTGIGLFRLRPQIIAVAEAAKLSEERKLNLEKINVELAHTNRLLANQQKALAHTAKMSALGEMAGGIAHEINSPLGIITIHANQLQRFQQRGQLTPEILLKESELISSTAKRIGDIITGLRAFAREGENDPFENTPVSSIIENALVLCQTRFKTHGIQLKVSAIPSDLTIECRSVQMVQVIVNLLNNAFDAVEKLSEKWISIDIEEMGNFVIISVTDSGKGISPEILPKITLPFFTTKEVGKGTGLGLSISKGIVDSHRGSLQVETDSPNTKFVMQIPKHQNTKRE